MSMTWSWLGTKKTMPTGLSLQNLRVASPCPAQWEQMAGDDRVRHCAECKLNVYNISEMTRREAEKLIASREGRLCARLFRRADGTLITQNCPVGLRNMVRRVSRVAGAALSAIMSVALSAAQTAPTSTCPDHVQKDQNQNQKGTRISILVTDPQGAVIPNAQVNIEQKDGKHKASGMTDSSGSLHLSLPAPGSYVLTIKSEGFKSYRRELEVKEGKTQQIAAKLLVSDVSVTVGIIGVEPMTDTTSSQITNTFSGDLLRAPR